MSYMNLFSPVPQIVKYTHLMNYIKQAYLITAFERTNCRKYGWFYFLNFMLVIVPSLCTHEEKLPSGASGNSEYRKFCVPLKSQVHSCIQV